MITSRREFIAISGQYALGAASLGLLADAAEAQLFGVPAPLILTALRTFAANVMTDVAAQSLFNWLNKAFFTAAPPPPPPSSPIHFHAAFSTKVIVNVPGQPRFAASTKTRPATALIVDHRPKLARSSRVTVPANQEVNERELNGFSNFDNDCIYNGSYFDIPAEFDYRQVASRQDHLTFRGLVADNKIADASIDEDPRLEYVRQFCTCNGRMMKGFGYRCGQNQEFEGFYPYGRPLIA